VPFLDPLTRKRLARFRRIRRGYGSLLVLTGAYLASLGAELFVGNRPIVVCYGGACHFPALTGRYYPQTLFGGSLDLEADFRALRDDPEFRRAGGWMVLPLHPYSPLESVRVPGDPPPSRPTWRHPLGTDDRGRDVLARIVYGFRVSMTFALVLATASYALGIAIGGVQGYLGGRVDLLGQRLVEVWSALPFLYVVILISSVVTPNLVLLVVILLLFRWIGISRYVRAEFLRERSRDYVTAAQALGASAPRIMLGHILGNALTSVVTLFPFALVFDIFALTALDFLGFGLPPPTPSWGELFSQGRTQIRSYWLIVFPFLALFTTLLLTTFVGEAMREAWDPKEYHRREE
jgi:microcin C transport system permease protein